MIGVRHAPFRLWGAVLLALAVVAVCIAAFSASAVAVDPLEGACASSAAAASEICQADSTTNPVFGPDGVLTRVTNALSIIVVVVAILIIIIAGISYSTSSGNPQQTAQARNSIIYAGVALGMAALAQVIVQFVLSNL